MNRHSPGLRDFERFLRIAVHLKFLFGSPKSSLIVLVVLGLLIGGGYLAVRTYLSPQATIVKADKLYEANKMEGVSVYKDLLLKTDFFNPEKKWIGEDERPRFYRRIISFEARYGERGEALDYSRKAWEEGIHGLKFEYEETNELWYEATGSLSGRHRKKQRENLRPKLNVLTNNLNGQKQNENPPDDQDSTGKIESGPQPPDPDPLGRAKAKLDQGREDDGSGSKDIE